MTVGSSNLKTSATPATVVQLRSDGSLRHLLNLEGLPRATLEQLLTRAAYFLRALAAPPARNTALAGITVVNLFSEPSTRTRFSFELAALRLGADVSIVEVELSSRLKGESMLDTIATLEAMHVDIFVVRDAQEEVPNLVAANIAPYVSVLSAGAGSYSHPTQGLLDALTVIQRKGRIEDLSIAIVGDVRHSRVARSAWHAFSILGAKDLRLVAPNALMPNSNEFEGCARYSNLNQGIKDCDVVMMLRVQKERMTAAAISSDEEYFSEWGLSQARLSHARADAIVMHPGPMNRGIEIASDVADGVQSVIRDQVRNGVAVRMAVLETVILTRPRL
ncbi:MAG: aspartate carbamoyltransferase catalytic subunit [Gammaproteobacteria bacterium]|nr:aspartate carbamoyltransferase catalytic subunit [Gammaproteobacteria bacterium]